MRVSVWLFLVLFSAVQIAFAQVPKFRTEKSSATSLVTKIEPVYNSKADVPAINRGYADKRRSSVDLLRQYHTQIFGRTTKSEFRYANKNRVSNQREIIDLIQHYEGIPVAGAQFKVHYDGDNLVLADGMALPLSDDFDAAYRLEEEQVKSIALLWSAANLDSQVVVLSVEQQIFNQSFYVDRVPQENTYRAWKVLLSGFAINHEIWIDDVSAAVIYDVTRVASAKNRQTYDLNGHYANYYLARSETSQVSSIADVNYAHDYAGDTYDFFYDRFGRDSYDNQGAAMISFVRYCPDTGCPFINAVWTGAYMVYGHDLPKSDDVVAHEFAHGVIQTTANMVYQNQPGALNEAYADILGESVDLLNNAGNDDNSVRWNIGEELPVYGPFRDMKNPSRFGHPERYNDANYYWGTQDYGGVHINSGVLNHAYALTVDGGSFNQQEITAIGFDKALQVYYHALVTYLTTNSQFSDAFYALTRSCTDLIGSHDIEEIHCTQVCNALLAVELNTTGDSCYTRPQQGAADSLTPIIQLLLTAR